MKKVLFVVALVAFSVLLFVACFAGCSDAVGQVAEAEFAINTINGIVNPNLLPVFDFSTFTSFTFTSVSDINSSLSSSTPEGLYIDDRFTVTSPYPSTITNNSSNSAYSCTFSSSSASPCYFYLVFTLPTISVNSSASFNIISMTNSWSGSTWRDITTGSTVVGSGGALNTFTGGSNVFRNYKSVNLNSSYSNHKICIHFFTPSTTSFTVVGLKFEIVSASVSPSYTFTGLTIPGYSFTSSFDGLSGIVNENLLYGSDFYKTPYYNGISASHPNNVWYSNLPSSSYTYDFDMLLGVDRCDISIPSGIPTGFGYSYSDSTNNFITDVTFTVGILSPTLGGSISLAISSLSTIESVRFSASSDLQILTVSLASVGSTNVFSLNITVDAPSDDLQHVYIYYTKLEFGSFFTGYVYPEHDISFTVRDNLMNNYNFATVPQSMTNNRVDNGVTDAWVSSYAFNYYYNSDDGLVIDNSSNSSAAWLWYHIDVPSDFVYENYTFTIRLGCDFDCLIEFTDYYRYDSSYPYVPSGNSLHVAYYLACVDPYSITVTDELKEDLYIFIRVNVGATLTLYFDKLELGDNFTGFCPSFGLFYNDGYEDGYNQGFTSGMEVYAAQNVTLSFNNVESPYRVEQGFLDWGFANVQQLIESYATLSSYFYDSLGFTVLSSGSFSVFDSVTGSMVGVNYWVSRDADVNTTDFPYNGNIVQVLVFDHYSTLSITDTSYPANWNPVEYPMYRVVNLFFSRGMEDILELYQDASYNNGQSAGYTSGYTQGFDQGKAEGFTLANEVQSNRGWLGFFSAFVDVPVTVLTSLLDFDFFGFNLFNLVRILVFVSLFYLVIRLIVKGKVS